MSTNRTRDAFVLGIWLFLSLTAAEAGTVVWRYKSRAKDTSMRSRPVILPDESVLFGNGDGKVTRLRAGGSETEWLVGLDGAIRGDLQMLDDTFVVATTLKGTVNVLNVALGALRWRFTHPSGGWVFSPLVSRFDASSGLPVSDNDKPSIVVGLRTNTVIALDGGSGKKLFAIEDLGAGVWASPTLIDGKQLVFGVTAEATIHSRSFKDGTFKKDWVHDLAPTAKHWKQRLKCWVFPQPVYHAATNSVVFGAADGILRSVDTKEGTLLWDIKLREGAIGATAGFVLGKSVAVVVTEKAMLCAVLVSSNTTPFKPTCTQVSGPSKTAPGAPIEFQDNKVVVAAAGSMVVYEFRRRPDHSVAIKLVDSTTLAGCDPQSTADIRSPLAVVGCANGDVMAVRIDLTTASLITSNPEDRNANAVSSVLPTTVATEPRGITRGVGTPRPASAAVGTEGAAADLAVPVLVFLLSVTAALVWRRRKR